MKQLRRERGSVTLMETVAVGTLAVMIIAVYWTFTSSVDSVAERDGCVVQADTNGLDIMAADVSCP